MALAWMSLKASLQFTVSLALGSKSVVLASHLQSLHLTLAFASNTKFIWPYFCLDTVNLQ